MLRYVSQEEMDRDEEETVDGGGGNHTRGEAQTLEAELTELRTLEASARAAKEVERRLGQWVFFTVLCPAVVFAASVLREHEVWTLALAAVIALVVEFPARRSVKVARRQAEKRLRNLSERYQSAGIAQGAEETTATGEITKRDRLYFC